MIKQLRLLDHIQVVLFDQETKNSRKKLSSLPRNFTVHYGDISNRKDVDAVTGGLDAVIHLAAIIPPLADENPELAERVNVKGTENLIKSLEQHSPCAFFIYSSSISVYGDRLHNPEIKIDDPLNPSVGDEYALTKIKCEALISASSLKWTIFRLAAIMGNHKISKLMFHMPLDTSVEICTPADTARAFVNAFEKSRDLEGRIFNLGGGENCRISYRDLLSRSFEIYGMGKLAFPDKAFAEKNFHCGNYADGGDLNDILDFRRDNLQSYFAKVKSEVKPGQKFLTQLIHPAVKRHLLKQSEPYEAFKKNDEKLKARFFNN